MHPNGRVSIPIRVINDVVVTFEGAPLPALKDCIGDLVVPAFALKDPEDLDRLTEEKLWPLFKEGEGPSFQRVRSIATISARSPWTRSVCDLPVKSAITILCLASIGSPL
jgi:hypothetical protein